MSVIVTSAKSRIAYNIVRSLGEKGIDVCTADFAPLSMSFASRYSKAHFLYPSPFREERAFINSIIEHIDRLKARVVMPVYEETFLMAKFKGELLRHASLVIPDYGQILTAHNKNIWAGIASGLGIPVPDTCDASALIKDASLIEKLRYPALIKPKQGGGGWAITQADSADALKRVLGQETYLGLAWDRFFIQEKIEGENHCVAMLFREGGYRAKVTYKQLRDYPVKGGQATLRISLSNPKAEGFLLRLLEHLKWHGVCQADFVVDRATGTPYLIDLNPRFWGSLAHAIASGVDFPYLVYKIAVEGDVEPVKGFKTGVVSRWLGGDIRAFFPLLKASRNKIEFFRRFVFPSPAPVFYDDITVKDPLPFFLWSLDSVYRMLKYRSTTPVSHDSLEGVWE